MRRFVFFAVLVLGSTFLRAADDDVLVIEQDYNLVESGKGGVEAKDVRQKLYVHKDFVCIDEFGGKDANKPTETVLIDLKDKKIVDIFHDTKDTVTESFSDRKKRLEKKKKIAREDIDAQPDGPQKDKMVKLYRSLLDDDRKFKLEQDAADTKTVAGVTCQGVKITAKGADYTPAHFYLHPEIEMPYENAEVLYLLQITGEKLAQFLKDNKEVFKKVPMELHCELPSGGHLDTKVVSVTKTDRAKLNDAARPLGNPFEVPKDYVERETRKSTGANKADRPD